MGLMSEALTQILIPLASLVGIGFALLQWFLVSKVKISGGSELEDGCNDMLIEEDVQEEGIDSDATVAKCAEIQKAISEGGLFFTLSLNLFHFNLFTTLFLLSLITVVFGKVGAHLDYSICTCYFPPT